MRHQALVVWVRGIHFFIIITLFSSTLPITPYEAEAQSASLQNSQIAPPYPSPLNANYLPFVHRALAGDLEEEPIATVLNFADVSEAELTEVKLSGNTLVVKASVPMSYELRLDVAGQRFTSLFDNSMSATASLPEGDLIAFHIVNRNGVRIPFQTYGDLGDYGYRVLRTDKPVTLFVGQRASGWEEFQSFVKGYIDASESSTFGTAQPDLVTTWQGARIQRFQEYIDNSGKGDGGSVLVNNPNCNLTYQVRGLIREKWEALGGPASVAGFPIGNETIASKNEYEFTNRPISEYQHGFISSKDGINFDFYPYYPQIGDIRVSFANASNNQATATIRARVIPTPGRANTEPVTVGATAAFVPVPFTSFVLNPIGNYEFEGTYPVAVPLDSDLSFSLQVTRTVDLKQGFFPPRQDAIAQRTVKVQLGTTSVPSPFPPDPATTCSADGGGIIPPPNTRPEVIILKMRGDGQGNVAVLAQATDDSGVVGVTLSSDKGTVPDPVMQLWPSAGPDVYAGVVRGIDPNDLVTVTVTAVDSSGLEGFDTASERIEHSGSFGDCSQQCYEGNPINAVTGNNPDVDIDLLIPGPGNTVIVVERWRNSQREQDGPFGRGSSFTYSMTLELVNDPLLQGVQVRYGDGKTVNFQETSTKRYDSISPSNFDYLLRDESGYVLHQKDRTTYRFSAEGRLIEIRDRNNVPISLTYDSAGFLDTISDASGRTVDFTWENGYITLISAPEGKTLHYIYEGHELRSFVDARGKATTYRYDPAGRVTEITRPNTFPRVRQAYDDRGRVQWQIIGDDNRRDFAYNDVIRTTVVTDAYDFATTYTYDERYFIKSVKDALEYTAYYQYDDSGNLEQYTDRRRKTWIYTYDKNGNVLTRTDPIDACVATPYTRDVTRWDYDDYNQVTSMTNALDYTWRYEYDPRGNLITTTDPLSRTTRATYDAWGQPITITDANGHTTVHAFDIYGNLVKAVDPEQNVTRWAYDLLGRELSQTDANGRTSVYKYDLNDNLTHVGDPKGRISRYDYDENNLLVRAVDRRNGERLYVYNPSDLTLAAERDQEQRWTQYEYDQLDRQTKTIDALRYETMFTYDSLGNITGIIDAMKVSLSYGHDPNGNLIAIATAINQHTSTQFDAANRARVVTDAAGERVELCYNAEDQLVRTAGPRGEVAEFSYDPLGRLIAYKDPQKQTIRYEYDAVGNLTATITALGYRTDYTYDKADRLITLAQPALNGGLRPTTHYTYDGVGNVLTITNPLGHIATLTYDANDNLQMVTDPEGGVTQFSYDEENNLAQVTNPNGGTVTLTYNRVDLPIAIRNAEGQTTRLAYDPVNNLVRMVNALDRPTEYEYDPMRRLVRETDPLGYSTLYRRDQLGRITGVTDANNHTTSYSYDILNRLIAVTDALNQTTRYGYDEVGNLISVTDANQRTTTFEYNLRNQLLSETNSLGKTWRYAYDPDGRLAHKVDPMERSITYDYDSNNRLTAILYGAAPQAQKPVLFNYDLAGNQTNMCDALGCTSHTYDKLGRRIATTDWLNRTVTRTYDAAGNLTKLRYPNGKTVSYTYNLNNWLKTFADPSGATSTYERNPLGQVTRLLHPNQTVASFDYDAANRLTRLDNRKQGGAEPQSAFAFVMDAVGNRTKVTETRAAFDGSSNTVTIPRSYVYNEIDQLVRTITDGLQSDLTYRFDPVGNRLEQTGSALKPDAKVPQLPVAPRPEQTAFAYNEANQLISAGGAAFAYNDNGGRTHKTERQPDGSTLITEYRYDYEDRLIGVTEITSSTAGTKVRMVAEYTYDGYGRRAIQKVSYPSSSKPSQTTSYLYDGFDIIGAQVQERGITNEAYYYLAPSPVTGIRRPIEVERLPNTATGFKGDRHWYQTDGLDNVTTLTNDRGTISSPLLYDEYGQILAGSTSLALHAFNGQAYDPATKLHFFYARAYDPATGTWLSQDRHRGNIADPMSMARYAFVANNPTNAVDLLGYWGWNPIKAVQDTVSKAVDTVKEKADQAASWVKENQGEILKTALTVGTIAGTAALCAATAGVGCVVGAALIAGAASYGGQVVDNACVSGQGGCNFTKEAFTENIDVRQIAFDAGMAVVSGGSGRLMSTVGGKLLSACKGSVCTSLVKQGMDLGDNTLTQMASNLLDDDPCSGLFDGMASNILPTGSTRTNGHNKASSSKNFFAIPLAKTKNVNNKVLLLDTNVVISNGKDFVANSSAVKSTISDLEIKSLVNIGKIKYPNAANVIKSKNLIYDIDTAINIRGNLTPKKTGNFADGIIGAQSINNNMTLVTKDSAFGNAVIMSGGSAISP